MAPLVAAGIEEEESRVLSTELGGELLVEEGGEGGGMALLPVDAVETGVT